MMTDYSYREIIGKNLYTARALTGLSQPDAAEKLGIAQPTLSGWETGRRGPSAEMLVRAAAAYGRSIRFFYLPPVGTDDYTDRITETGQPLYTLKEVFADPIGLDETFLQARPAAQIQEQVEARYRPAPKETHKYIRVVDEHGQAHLVPEESMEALLETEDHIDEEVG